LAVLAGPHLEQIFTSTLVSRLPVLDLSAEAACPDGQGRE
jgi:hypothetical protein